MRKVVVIISLFFTSTFLLMGCSSNDNKVEDAYQTIVDYYKENNDSSIDFKSQVTKKTTYTIEFPAFEDIKVTKEDTYYFFELKVVGTTDTGETQEFYFDSAYYSDKGDYEEPVHDSVMKLTNGYTNYLPNKGFWSVFYY